MHELSICYALLDQVERIRVQHGSPRALRIEVLIGPLSGIVPDLLESAFPIAAAGTCADTATLVIRQAPLRVRCNKCNEEAEVPLNRLLCPSCGTWQCRVIAGDELLLKRVELVPGKEEVHV